MPFQMPPAVVMVDGEGNVHADLRRLRASFASAVTIAQIDEFLVHSLGFIAITVRGSHLQVKLRPSRVSKTTLAGALYYLADFPPERFTASIYDETSARWQVTILPNAAVALGAVVEKATGQPARLMRRRALQPNEIVAHPHLLSAIGSWQETDGAYGAPELDRLAYHEMGGSFIRLERRKGDMVLDRVGSGLPAFAQRSLRGLTGQNFAGHVDRAYANACLEAYTQVVDRWEPLAEQVEAKAFWPGHGFLTRRYMRVVIPVRGPRGSVGVFSATRECAVPSICEAAG